VANCGVHDCHVLPLDLKVLFEDTVRDVLDLDHDLLTFFLQVFDLFLLDIEKLNLDKERDSAGVSLLGQPIDCCLEVS